MGVLAYAAVNFVHNHSLNLEIFIFQIIELIPENCINNFYLVSVYNYTKPVHADMTM